VRTWSKNVAAIIPVLIVEHDIDGCSFSQVSRDEPGRVLMTGTPRRCAPTAGCAIYTGTACPIRA